MRVRMLQTHDVTESHPEHGELSLVYPAGSTQTFDDITAATLVKAGKAIAHPETSSRVRMNYSLSEDQISAIVNDVRRAAYVPDAEVNLGPELLAGGGTFVFRKGELVHFPSAVAEVLCNTAPATAEGQTSVHAPYAVLAIDNDADPVAATRAAAIADAVARKAATAEAEALRAARDAQLAAARKAQQDAFVAARKAKQEAKQDAPAGSGRSSPAPIANSANSTPAAAPSSTPTKE